MKFNISYPLTGAQKTVEIDDDKKCSIFFDKRMGQVVEADNLGEEYKGYVLKITGGNDKQGFPMRQGVLFKGRVRILMRKGHKGYRPRKDGEMKRKSIRGCIVGQDIRVLALQVVKKGANEIAGLTDQNVPRRLGPKRLTKLRRLFGFKKADGVAIVQKNLIRRTWTTKDGKKRQKAPKIQRLVTESRLRRKTIQKKTEQARKNQSPNKLWKHIKNWLMMSMKLTRSTEKPHQKSRRKSRNNQKPKTLNKLNQPKQLNQQHKLRVLLQPKQLLQLKQQPQLRPLHQPRLYHNQLKKLQPKPKNENDIIKQSTLHKI
ncbi:unnamed protein product (macronuclear) [Paramecium tetraurelia]|uniref:40S ribosomal protein S6 n=1 Tax=Paramecium tetraurelia TaxID=5888 RepID=A0CU37_PARTE|nr:uncharacterized protein GSPATT00010503001 [Paramecium tetraurelia]CAK74304.1 unnamed protein product [Paramecium tetraurelia]|eukprot:XP_001441701.1 hypothetical protein (macronuclear) [Paramecium tetraurelia strain d4-2]